MCVFILNCENDRDGKKKRNSKNCCARHADGDEYGLFSFCGSSCNVCRVYDYFSRKAASVRQCKIRRAGGIVPRYDDSEFTISKSFGNHS